MMLWHVTDRFEKSINASSKYEINFILFFYSSYSSVSFRCSGTSLAEHRLSTEMRRHLVNSLLGTGDCVAQAFVPISVRRTLKTVQVTLRFMHSVFTSKLYIKIKR